MSVSSSQSILSRLIERKPLPFYVGAFADTVVGVGLVAFAKTIAPLILPDHPAILGIAVSSVLRFLGLFLLVFALDTVMVARSNGVLGRFRSWIVAANWATVALAVLVLGLWHGALSLLGIAMVAAIALAVGVFASLQQRAI
ncbi:MAG: hypothetical protein K2Y35_14295 [Burkholderiales bacterium]|nr:hypothetical protein [Burkholderiales bacterium]